VRTLAFKSNARVILNKQASKQASKQTNKQQTNKQTNKQTSGNFRCKDG
jgi:hypothetical protein